MLKTLHRTLGTLLVAALATTAQAQDNVQAMHYSIDFSTISTSADFIDSGWTVLDNSTKSGKTWTPGTCYTDNGYIADIVTLKDYNAAMDDYLISPAFTLEGGKTYVIKTLSCFLSGTDGKLTLELLSNNTDATTASEVDDLTPEDKGYDGNATTENEITMETTGTYYLAFHGTTSASGASVRMHVFNFSIALKDDSGSPETPEVEVEELPYEVVFSETQEGWTAVDASENTGTTWTYEPEYGFYDKFTKQFYGDVTTPAASDYKDYYVSPAFYLEKDKTYNVMVLSAFNNSNGALKLSLVAGPGTDPTTYEEVDTLNPMVDYYDIEQFDEISLEVTETGVYHLAILAQTVDAEKSTRAHLFAFGIDEEDNEPAEAAAPNSVKRATATMTEQHQVALSFTTPKRDEMDELLTDDLTVLVYEGKELVSTLEGVAADTAINDTITGVPAGDHTYDIIVKKGELVSDTVSVDVTTTVVVPGKAEDFEVEYMPEYKYLDMGWNFPTKDTDGHDLADDAELYACVYFNDVLTDELDENPVVGLPGMYSGAGLANFTFPEGTTTIKVVIELDDQESEAVTYDVVVDAIGNITVNNVSKKDIYTIGGQKVNKAERGLFIINGKKVMVK